MTGVEEVNAVVGANQGMAGDDAVSVDWDVGTRRRLGSLGLAAPELESVDVVVLDRREGTTTPVEPGALTVGGRRVVVVPDESEGSPSVEVWVAGGRERYGGVVDALRRTVALDASIDRAFDAARRPTRAGVDEEYPVDDGSVDGARAIERAVLALEGLDTPLAVGGFAAAAEPLR